jgi:hypothetical protein
MKCFGEKETGSRTGIILSKSISLLNRKPHPRNHLLNQLSGQPTINLNRIPFARHLYPSPLDIPGVKGPYGAAPELIIFILDKSYFLTIGSLANPRTIGGTTYAKVHLWFWIVSSQSCIMKRSRMMAWMPVQEQQWRIAVRPLVS